MKRTLVAAAASSSNAACARRSAAARACCSFRRLYRVVASCSRVCESWPSAVRASVAVDATACDVVRWMRMPQTQRTISPVSKMKIGDYVKLTLLPQTEQHLRALFPNEPALERLGPSH